MKSTKDAKSVKPLKAESAHTKVATATAVLKRGIVKPYAIPKDLLEFVRELLQRTGICDYIADHHAPVDWPSKFARALIEMTDLQAEEEVSRSGHVVWDTFGFDDDQESALSGLIGVWKALKDKGLLDIPIDIRRQLSLEVHFQDGAISVSCPPGKVLEQLKAQHALEKERAAYRELYIKFKGEDPLKPKT
jgi:hypothetical protein